MLTTRQPARPISRYLSFRIGSSWYPFCFDDFISLSFERSLWPYFGNVDSAVTCVLDVTGNHINCDRLAWLGEKVIFSMNAKRDNKILEEFHVESSQTLCFFLNVPIPTYFCSLSSFLQSNNNNFNWKNVDVVLGIRTHGRRMVGTDGSTVLWRPSSQTLCLMRDCCPRNVVQKLQLFTKVRHSGPLFFIFVFPIQLTLNVVHKCFADDLIRTKDLRSWKLPLYQLSHNHRPIKNCKFLLRLN